jgi:predicted CoA-binding protein
MQIKEILNSVKTIAVFGMSQNKSKAANSVPAYMEGAGYTIVPINPSAQEIDGKRSYKDIDSVPDRIDMLNVFRPSEDCEEIVLKAVERRKQKGDIDVIWLQLGIENDKAKAIAESAGIAFIQDKCLYIEHRNL